MSQPLSAISRHSQIVGNLATRAASARIAPSREKSGGRHNYKPLYFGCAHLFERAGVLGWRVGLDNLQLDAELLRRCRDCFDVCVMSRWQAGQNGYFPYGRQTFREDA